MALRGKKPKSNPKLRAEASAPIQSSSEPVKPATDNSLSAEPTDTKSLNPSKRFEFSEQMNQGIGRFPIIEVSPQVDGGRFTAKAVVEQRVNVSARVFREGHDALSVYLSLTDPDGNTSYEPMESINPGLDYWQGSFKPLKTGSYFYTIEAFDNPYLTWVHNAKIKIAAGIDQDLMCQEGVLILNYLKQQISTGHRAESELNIIQAALDALQNTALSFTSRIAPATSAEMHALLSANPLKRGVTHKGPIEVMVERKLALYGAWYEFFPRSEGAYFSPEEGWVSGNFKSSLKQLERIKKMGFDVAYLTPIHPIGTTHRKGRNNSLTALPSDPGSPYAIGSADGGHESIHPDLGTEADFKSFLARAKELELEVAMDIALQCSPDHPWVKEHPNWFEIRADGSIAYAENPPKKYQDIYPLTFDYDYRGLYEAIKQMLLKWVDLGVKIFRVDNPHTKPLRFWEELLAEFKILRPDVIFLAEAFTKPAMMHTLAKVGFQQSYTYFTWRNSAAELQEYMQELISASAYMRPSFWPTTHDILTPYMSEGGINAFRIRAILAATLSPTWGVYSGYELVENVPRPGAEENIDNEKYEYKPRDYEGALASGRSLEPLITRLNQLRRHHIALQTLDTLRFHSSENSDLLVFSKHVNAADTATGLDDTIIVVSMTNPHGQASGYIHLDTEALNIHSDFLVEDLLTGEQFLWDRSNYVALNATNRPAHILRVIRY